LYVGDRATETRAEPIASVLLRLVFGIRLSTIFRDRRHRHRYLQAAADPSAVSLTTVAAERTFDGPREQNPSMPSKILTPTSDERADHLRSARNSKMARSAHAYVRGSTLKFYQWLADSEARIPAGPAVWICGDCHMGNLGPVADAKGRIAIQIRDLDQTVLGNPAHDLIRLALSLASMARGADLSGIATVKVVEAVMEGYESALEGATLDEEPDQKQSRTIRDLLTRSMRRRWRHLAAERLETAKPRVPLGKKFWTISEEERAAIGALFGTGEVHRTILSLQARDEDVVEVIDAAYWMKGCSSLGRLRFAAMLRVGKGDDANLCLVDIKEATAAAAPRSRRRSMPRDNAQRVVTGAQALSPFLGQRMVATRLLERAVVVRELMPQDLKLEVETLGEREAVNLARYLANVTGRAHARQMDSSTKAAWRGELTRARPASIDAPAWLWQAVVELVSIHEAAYLEHCRRFAQLEAA
jgi:uncharacterized protein (DUF2252 family)